MSSPLQRGHEAAKHERAISSLSDRTGASLAEVRVLFARELARLELGAKVRSYLAVLTASNVRATLRRQGQVPGESHARPYGANRLEAARTRVETTVGRAERC
jgi:hypothetical protein